MKKILVFGLIIVLMVYLSGCGYFFDKPMEFGYQYADPAKAIEHYFEIELPKDAEFLEYEYEYSFDEVSAISAKILFSADHLTAFYECMNGAGYALSTDETEIYETQLHRYQNQEKRRRENISWWDFEPETAERYHRCYGNGYIKGWFDTYIFVINDGESVTVYMDLGT